MGEISWLPWWTVYIPTRQIAERTSEKVAFISVCLNKLLVNEVLATFKAIEESACETLVEFHGRVLKCHVASKKRLHLSTCIEASLLSKSEATPQSESRMDMHDGTKPAH